MFVRDSEVPDSGYRSGISNAGGATVEVALLRCRLEPPGGGRARRGRLAAPPTSAGKCYQMVHALLKTCQLLINFRRLRNDLNLFLLARVGFGTAQNEPFEL